MSASTSVVPASGVISFSRGVPPPDVFPAKELAECARAVVARDAATVLNYGPAAGYGPLREWIAERHGVPARHVLVTPGSLLGLGLLARVLLADGGRAIVEAPTYDRMLRILRAAGAEIETVPRGREGLDLDALEARLRRGRAPRLLYAMPTFHNPTGLTLATAERRRLLDLAREHEVTVLEDDPYGLVRFEGEAPPTLLELSRADAPDGDWAVFSSSFSKTVAPGLRVGYQVLPERLAAAVEQLAADTYVSPPILPQAELFEFVSRGLFTPNLERVRAILGTRHDAMVGALAAELPAGASWTHPGGGYFLWLDLPPSVDTRQLLVHALENGVSFVPGGDFYAEDGGESAARLAFSFPSPEEIREGVRRLGSLVRELAPS